MQTAKLHLSILEPDHISPICKINNDLHENVKQVKICRLCIIISCDNQLQELNISDSYLHSTSAIIISNVLQGISTLKKLDISKNKITDKAADDIAVAISSNFQLQELDISDNDLRATGAITISKALQGISSTLTKLYISSNKITDKAADDIAAAISCNTQLQDLILVTMNFKLQVL